MSETDFSALTEGTMLQAMGAQPRSVSPDEIVLELAVSDRVAHRFGGLNGGAALALAENACAIGAQLHAGSQFCRCTEASGSHLRTAAIGETVTAVAIPLHRGRTSQVWNVDVTNEAGKTVSVVRCSFIQSG